MSGESETELLLHYLQAGRDALIWKLEGLSEYEVRRPMTSTGMNLLGLVKHVAGVEYGYLTACMGRDAGIETPWLSDDSPDNADMWATVEESREEILSLYREVWAADDAAVRELGLDARGEVPWWGAREVTMRRLLVHMIAETHRHAGHADIVRELIDHSAGMRQSAPNLPAQDARWWSDYVATLERMARAAGGV